MHGRGFISCLIAVVLLVQGVVPRAQAAVETSFDCGCVTVEMAGGCCCPETGAASAAGTRVEPLGCGCQVDERPTAPATPSEKRALLRVGGRVLDLPAPDGPVMRVPCEPSFTPVRPESRPPAGPLPLRFLCISRT